MPYQGQALIIPILTLIQLYEVNAWESIDQEEGDVSPVLTPPDNVYRGSCAIESFEVTLCLAAREQLGSSERLRRVALPETGRCKMRHVLGRRIRWLPSR